MTGNGIGPQIMVEGVAPGPTGEHRPATEELIAHLTGTHGCSQAQAYCAAVFNEAVQTAGMGAVLGPDGRATIAIDGPQIFSVPEHQRTLAAHHAQHHAEASAWITHDHDGGER